ncbi:MAG: LOG family protein [Nitrososphaeria archaeon]
MQIGIAAHSGEVPETLIKETQKLLELIKKDCEDPVLLLGGYWGLMKTVVDQASKLNLTVLLLLPIENENVRVPKGVYLIKTGEEYRARSVPMVRSSDFLIALGGSSGTMIEALMGYAMGKEVFVLKGNGMPSDRLESLGEFPDQRKNGRLRFYDSAEKLVNDLCSSRASKEISETG